eukprot:TRINITY_DN33779_c0_g1_i1.p1 TRINITY_DN33779_c0_g1~~TRINITY_DN33779_c0_g1_i1.p1  ORF type:complete len:200 (+),score=22.43 TRINITY_DN33779_c0_g1_i1:28-627(+)
MNHEEVQLFRDASCGGSVASLVGSHSGVGSIKRSRLGVLYNTFFGKNVKNRHCVLIGPMLCLFKEENECLAVLFIRNGQMRKVGKSEVWIAPCLSSGIELDMLGGVQFILDDPRFFPCIEDALSAPDEITLLKDSLFKAHLKDEATTQDAHNLLLQRSLLLKATRTELSVLKSQLASSPPSSRSASSSSTLYTSTSTSP